MGSNQLRLGDRVHYDDNDWDRIGVVKSIDGNTAFVEYDGEQHPHEVTSLGIVLTHGVSRDKDEHELVVSGLHEAMEKLRALGPQIDRAIAASTVGRAHSLMTAFGIVIPKTIRDVISTALFASTFADTLKEHKQIDPKTRMAVTIIIEAVRLIARAFEVK
jgi:hypothetical protein